MIKTFQIDFIRAIVDYKLSLNDGEVYFGLPNIANFSFYEHLEKDEEVNRYVERFRQLTEQQNRTLYNGFGILNTNQSPSITNLYDAFISPFEFTYTLRCKLKDRDKMIATIYHLIETLKGRKIDIAQLDSGKLFPVCTITDRVHIGDFIITPSGNDSLTTKLTTYFSSLTTTYGITVPTWKNDDYIYSEVSGKLVRYIFKDNTWLVDDLYWETNGLEHNSFEKYKVSLAFNDTTTNSPFTLNAEEYCTIVCGGSATLVNDSVRLGNDLVRLYIKKNKVILTQNSNFSFSSGYTELEPLELPSNANANSVMNQLRSNYFVPNSHTDSVAHTLQYTFVADLSITLIKQWFAYARYHKCNLAEGNAIQETSITPNIIYDIREQWSSWGIIEFVNVLGKLNEDIDLENTEADIMTMALSFQLQGENN